MNDALAFILALYVFVFIGTLGIGVMAFVEDPSWRVRKKAARAVFLSPIWPVMVMIIAFCGMKKMWHSAEWGNQ